MENHNSIQKCFLFDTGLYPTAIYLMAINSVLIKIHSKKNLLKYFLARPYLWVFRLIGADKIWTMLRRASFTLPRSEVDPALSFLMPGLRLHRFILRDSVIRDLTVTLPGRQFTIWPATWSCWNLKKKYFSNYYYQHLLINKN